MNLSLLCINTMCTFRIGVGARSHIKGIANAFRSRDHAGLDHPVTPAPKLQKHIEGSNTSDTDNQQQACEGTAIDR